MILFANAWLKCQNARNGLWRHLLALDRHAMRRMQSSLARQPSTLRLKGLGSFVRLLKGLVIRNSALVLLSL